MNNIGIQLYTLRQKGYLAYEYNPFRNYQTDVDLYLIDDKYLVPKGMAVNIKNGQLLTAKYKYSEESNSYTKLWQDQYGTIIDSENIKETNSSGSELYAKAGSLIDLDTDKLNFDINHPVNIEVQPSYDGSVNLILNDGKNIPRLINSRFSAREKNTYEIVDRIGENDTNIYNSATFEKDTSLYFQYEDNPKIQYLGFVRGTLPVGSYCFYFTYCDSDDNESDYIAESGIIPVFIGDDGDPNSMDGGIKNQLTNKGIKLQLDNIDKSYNYIKVYYVRYFADYQQNRVYECKKLYNRYPVNSGTLFLQITGYEEAEDIDANILNITRFNPKNILTQAQCKNMLFFGNVVKNTDNYKELQDCALRIVPSIEKAYIDCPDINYLDGSGYYDSKTSYNNVGYFNNEYYRFGVVFIYQNGTLSNVYNTLGGELTQEPLVVNKPLYESNSIYLIRSYIKTDENGWIRDSSVTGQYVNSKGVCKILTEDSFDTSIGIKFNIPAEVINHLKEELGIRGLFFVRQKCVPTILGQCYLLPMDSVMEAPVISYADISNRNYVTECFLDNERQVVNAYSNRLYTYNSSEGIPNSISQYAYAGICPDFLLNQPYYNQIFNGASFKLQKFDMPSYLKQEGRFYNQVEDSLQDISMTLSDTKQKVKICSVTEDVPTVAIENCVYRLEMGKTEEAFRFRWVDVDNGSEDLGGNNSQDEAHNLVRGKFSPYLAIYSNDKLEVNKLYNIYQDSNISEIQEYQNRMDSSEPFYSVSDRYNFEELPYKTINRQLVFTNDPDFVDETKEGDKVLTCFRGDCFSNIFTYRVNRNFNDPSLPNNDQIIVSDTWKENYKPNDPTKWSNISRSDLNAVQMGSWITIKVKSSMNYALRSEDHSYVSEEALMGSPRSFYPRSKILYRGENKKPDSYLYNDAYRTSLGFKCYFTLQDINYIKDSFSNRIQYSAISIQDSFKNNYRESLSTYFRDYSQEYGSIQKLVGFEGYLLVIFEHAIAVAVVNERVLAGNSDGEPVFINTQNVLPEELTIITDTYGSQWPESVIKSEAGYVYGVDTIAKKIWRVKGQQLEILSDFKVNKFLIDNISLGERELYPIIGLKNVKTHYNNNKKDIMFTFYDDIYQDEEKVWNLCYNELLGQFITFYSWVPSYSENIDTKFFSFDRTVSKYLSLLYTCNYHNPDNRGVVLDTPMLFQNSNSSKIYYRDPEASIYQTVLNNDGTTRQKELHVESKVNDNNHLENGIIEEVQFRIEKDHWGFYKSFRINGNTLECINMSVFSVEHPVILLEITPYLSSINDYQSETVTETKFKTETVAITTQEIVNNNGITDADRRSPHIITDFYLHGQAGIFNVVEDLYPTYWYGNWHPFEFEFVVNDRISQQKIFNNLVLISNKAEPESFHFEIEGDNYEFSKDKRNMYFRQEATKNLYQNLGSDIIYNRYYTDVRAFKYTQEQKYRENNDYSYKNNYSKLDKVYPVQKEGLVQQVKSTIFPLYYERIDTYNDIYDKYHRMRSSDGTYDFENLSGSEISWNRDLNQFNIITHIKNNPIDSVGRLRGNSIYKEGIWNVQIPSITFMQKNEDPWPNVGLYNDLQNGGPLKGQYLEKIPPIVINSQYVPNDLNTYNVSIENLPNIYTGRLDTINKDDTTSINYNLAQYIDTSQWTSRKETKIRDKWIKIRIRYSGKNLAIIHSLVTLYNISYS